MFNLSIQNLWPRWFNQTMLGIPDSFMHPHTFPTLATALLGDVGVVWSEFMVSLAVSFGCLCMWFWWELFSEFGSRNPLSGSLADKAASSASVVVKAAINVFVVVFAVSPKLCMGLLMLLLVELFEVIRIYATAPFAGVVNLFSILKVAHKKLKSDSVSKVGNSLFIANYTVPVSGWPVPVPASGVVVHDQSVSESVKKFFWWSSGFHNSVVHHQSRSFIPFGFDLSANPKIANAVVNKLFSIKFAFNKSVAEVLNGFVSRFILGFFKSNLVNGFRNGVNGWMVEVFGFHNAKPTTTQKVKSAVNSGNLDDDGQNVFITFSQLLQSCGQTMLKPV